MSKGSSPRPFSVSQDEYGSNFDRIFGKKKPAESVPEPVDNDVLTVYNDERLVSKFDKQQKDNK